MELGTCLLYLPSSEKGDVLTRIGVFRLALQATVQTVTEKRKVKYARARLTGSKKA